MKILHVKEVAGSRCLRFVHKAWGVLMDEGLWSQTEVLINGAEQCVYAVVGRNIVGCIVFRVEDTTSVIAIAYVEPKHRSKGVYRALHDEYEIQSKTQGAKEAVNICYPTNVGIQATCKKLGYELRTQEWRKKL